MRASQEDRVYAPRGMAFYMAWSTQMSPGDTWGARLGTRARRIRCGFLRGAGKGSAALSAAAP